MNTTDHYKLVQHIKTRNIANTHFDGLSRVSFPICKYSSSQDMSFLPDFLAIVLDVLQNQTPILFHLCCCHTPLSGLFLGYYLSPIVHPPYNVYYHSHDSSCFFDMYSCDKVVMALRRLTHINNSYTHPYYTIIK